MSIQGIQPKLSAKLNPVEGRFEITDVGGKYILKPQNELYPQLPENEDLSMRLAATVGIQVPLHGLLYCVDGSMTYFIRRFDRGPRREKLALEDFAQLSGKTRDTKYESSMEQLIPILESHCTFPVIEKRELFLRTLFHFLIGNEDMHLKNFSLISREGKVELAPAYDFLNSTIALETAEEEIALPLRGKKRNLKKADFTDYFARERLSLHEKTVNETLEQIAQRILQWEPLIQISFLSQEMKDRYRQTVQERRKVLGI
jgi:serine/threonine-protein kinase HipA